jgi:oligopeptide transport system substrate-binding protein
MTRVEAGNEEQVYHYSNGSEPEEIDPHTSRGEPEHHIELTLFEGLVTEDPYTGSPTNGVAERWEIAPDQKKYTFYLRKNAKWSNGDPVTAHDFLNSWKRILTPSLGASYAYMLYPVKNAEAYSTNGIKDFSQVGFRLVNDHQIEIELHSPTPYFLALMLHNAWFPVHIPTILKHGKIDDRSNPWTKPGNFVGNGPFNLKEWKVNSHLLVEKSPTYWDPDNVKLTKVYFYPNESQDGEERSFRSGQIHTMKECPQPKIQVYTNKHPDHIIIYPILSVYFYRINTQKPPLNDARVRRALAMAIDRESLVKNVTRGGQIPARSLTPPETAGYPTKPLFDQNLQEAKRLLAEAGFPEGKGFPNIELLFNTMESHRAIAESIQEMWRKNLNIHVTLRNEEWKVYLKSVQNGDYFIARAGWGGDYIDPNTFLDLFLTNGGNNETGWGHPKYDELITKAGTISDKEQRYQLFTQAETLLMQEMPIIPLYFYTRPRLMQPSVKMWYPNPLDHNTFKYIYMDPASHKVVHR